jgi:tRNA-dihydrouridine synthase
VQVALADRGRFLLDYIDMLVAEGPGDPPSRVAPRRGHDRFVINKLRALCAWYTRGLDGGAQLREAVNHTPSVPALRETISQFFLEPD